MQLNQKQQLNYQEIHIDEKLNFNHQLSLICKKAARQINALQRLCKYVDYEGKLRIYEAFVASNFVYCSVAYHTFSLGHDRKIEKLNERALRLVSNDYESSYNDILIKTGKNIGCAAAYPRLPCVKGGRLIFWQRAGLPSNGSKILRKYWLKKLS